MSPIVVIILAVAIIAALVWFFRGKPVFVIEFASGDARLIQGIAPPAFLEDCEHIARDSNLTAGRVTATRGPGGIHLAFSGGLPPHIHQRLRNAWQVSGY